jgi:acylphosphatase
MSGGEARAKRYFVRGRVQGVGFRFFVVDLARGLGLRGFTRNLPDGRVEVVAQGDTGSLARLEGDLHNGPALSRVEGVDVQESETDPERTEFEIRF